MSTKQTEGQRAVAHPSAPTDQLDERLVSTHRRLGGYLAADFEGSIAVDSVTVSQLRTLHGLSENPMRMTEIANLVGVTRGTATALVDKLVARGLVRRFQKRTNRRLVLVKLTEAGRQCHDEAHARGLRRVAPLVDDLNEEERGDLSRSLELLNQVLDRRGAIPG